MKQLPSILFTMRHIAKLSEKAFKMKGQHLKELLVQDRKVLRGIDPVKAVLFLCARHTLLPEIFESFGTESTLSFLESFGGKTVKIPSIKAVKDAIMSITIWEEMEAAINKEEASKRLAKRFNVREGEIRLAYSKVKEMLDDQKKLQESSNQVAKAKTTGLKQNSRKRAGKPSVTAGTGEGEPVANSRGNRPSERAKNKSEGQTSFSF